MPGENMIKTSRFLTLTSITSYISLAFKLLVYFVLHKKKPWRQQTSFPLFPCVFVVGVIGLIHQNLGEWFYTLWGKESEGIYRKEHTF